MTKISHTRIARTNAPMASARRAVKAFFADDDAGFGQTFQAGRFTYRVFVDADGSLEVYRQS